MIEKFEIWGVKDPNISAQLALADRLDLFKREETLEVSCKIDIESGTTMAEEVFNAKEKPFAFAQTPITTILLHERGFSTKLVAPLADIAATQQVVIRESSGISLPKDLSGKRVGMAPGAAIYLAMKNMAKDCNLDLNTVRFVDLLPRDQLEAFKAGEIDVIASWEPWTTKARALGGEFYFSGKESEIPGIEGNINWLTNQSCLIVPDEYLKNYRDLVVAILNVLRKATDLINKHRSTVIEPLSSFFGISRDDLIVTMQKNKYSMSIDPLFKIGILEARDYLYESKKISKKFPENLLYDTSFLQQVDRSLVSIDESTLPEEIPIIEEDGIYYREDFMLHSTGSGLKFLLADDSRYVRATLAQVIKSIGGKVVGEATTGSEAIKMFANPDSRPNIVTMDLSMPEISGVDAIKFIRPVQMNV